jgi:hypothetical protein
VNMLLPTLRSNTGPGYLEVLNGLMDAIVSSER